MESSAFQFTLKKDWDYFPHYDKPQGHFVGRVEEIGKVKNWFIRREKGCFLVCGERGVGKTSLVFEALRKAKEDNKEGKLIPVIMNCSQLLGGNINNDENKVGSGKEGLHKKIIINLIRRLYTATKDIKDNPAKDELFELYNKAVASKAEIKREISLMSEIQQKTEVIISTQVEAKLTPEHIKMFFSSLGLVLGVPLISAGELLIKGFAWNLPVGLFLSVVPLAIPVSIYSKIVKTQKNVRSRKGRGGFNELYVYDNSIGNLEHDLYEVLEIMHSKKKFKAIFVIDEMDKLEKQLGKVVIDIIKTFKNLFTLSSGLFVFIAGDDIYEKVVKSKEGKTTEYTLFSDRIFLPRPKFSDLEGFISEVINMPEKEFVADKNFKQFRNFICFKAKSDFYELYYRIRDYIKSYDKENRPILKIKRLMQSERFLANIQKVVGLIYTSNRYENSSDWYDNNKLLIGLYDYIRDAKTPLKIVSEPLDDFEPLQFRIYQAKRDLIEFLLRWEYLTRGGQVMEEVEEVERAVDTYNWTGKDKEIPKRADYKLDFEEQFLNTINTYAGFVNDIEDLAIIIAGEEPPKAYNRKKVYNNQAKEYCGIDVLAVFNEYKSSKYGLERPVPIHISREVLGKYRKAIETGIVKLKDSIVQIVQKLIEESVELINHEITTLDAEPNLFSSTMTTIRDCVVKNNLSHVCLYWKLPIYSRQILIVQDFPEKVYDENKTLIDENAKSYLIINLNTSGEKYNLEYNENKNGKIRGFIDVVLDKSFLPVQEVAKEIRRRDAKKISVEDKRNFLRRDVDEVSLKEYTMFKYPELPVDARIQTLLLRDIDLEKYLSLEELDIAVERAKGAVNKYASVNPDVFKNGTDYLTKSLGFVDADFLQKHPFAQETRDAVEKYRKFVEPEKKRIWKAKFLRKITD